MEFILHLLGIGKKPKKTEYVRFTSSENPWNDSPARDETETGSGAKNSFRKKYANVSLGTELEFTTRDRLEAMYSAEIAEQQHQPPPAFPTIHEYLATIPLPPRSRLPDIPETPEFYHSMQVQKRDGRMEAVSFDKITARLRRLADDPFFGYESSTWRKGNVVIDNDPLVTGESLTKADPVRICQKVCNSIYDGVRTSELDELSAETAMSMATIHPDYGVLASRIEVSNMHKTTPRTLKEAFAKIGPERLETNIYELVTAPSDDATRLENAIDYTKDYQCDFFAIKTLTKVYLLCDASGAVVERPQHMWMRVALGIHGTDDISRVLETYKLLSERYFTHATPTLFNAGTKTPSLASCYLTGITKPLDSIVGIYDTLKNCALISKYGGGIGLHISDVRASGSRIRGTNGYSTGIVPMLKVFNDTARYVNQCCTPDTVVYCKSGPKRIKDVLEGDEVVTRDGTFQKVLKVFESDKEEDNLIAIETNGSVFETSWTRQHRILIRRGAIEEYVEASNVRPGDKVVFAIPGFCDTQGSAGEDTCRFVGICTAISDFIAGADPPSSLDPMDPDTVEFIKGYAMSSNAKAVGNIELPRFMHRPVIELRMLLHGILESIGCPEQLYYVVETKSFEVAAFLRYVLLRLKVLAEGIQRPDGTIAVKIPRHPAIQSSLPDRRVAKESDFPFEYKDGALYAEVKAVRKDLYTGKVYDLNVEANSNYLTDIGIVHNSGKRKGSIAVYLEPWHPDIMAFLSLKRNHGLEEDRARDLFLAVWTPDLFMRRVERDEMWTLFCPDKAPGLAGVYGAAFEEMYLRYEGDIELVSQRVPAREIWEAIVTSQIETGVPYVLFKDACNSKSNQKNLGTIRSSNLCVEIVEYSDEKEVAVCNLASVCLPKYVRKSFGEGGAFFDYEALGETIGVMVRNLNLVIDRSFYPVPEARYSNMRHRPIGLGVQGLADVFAMLKIPFDSREASELNRRIFESIYYYAVEASMRLAKADGPYMTYSGSPASEGILQFDLWNVTPSSRHDWGALKNDIQLYGLRNSLLVAPMPTASTAQIMGNNEGFEPFASNIYVRKTLAGEFTLLNKHLVRDLLQLHLWNIDLKDEIIREKGSIQSIKGIPDDIKAVYKTAFEISQKSVIDLAAQRGPFICQSQSLNLFLKRPTLPQMSSMLFYSWKSGLKSGLYYLRSLPATDPIAVTVMRDNAGTPSDREDCLMCSA